MDARPWVPQSFVPWLAKQISARALAKALGSDFPFRWNNSRGRLSVRRGRSSERSGQVATDCDAADAPAFQETFEQFFKEAELWPEAAALRHAWDELQETKAPAIEQLAIAANTDPITTRCFLCRGSSQPVLHAPATGCRVARWD
jgi:hypothetical protein